jgi:putative SOS response-associated peptidase YedK
MCARFSLTAPPELLIRFFGLVDPPDWTARYNIAPTQTVGVVRTIDGTRGWVPHRWGLLPPWADDLRTAARMINARSETIFDKPSFRRPIRTQRCLVPVSGFYEWTGPKGAKQPQLFTPREGELLAFAGIWERWIPRDQPVKGETLDLFGKKSEPILSFSILTTSANRFVAPIHHRMPVFMTQENFGRWLDPNLQDPTAIQSLLGPAAEDLLTVRAVNPALNNPRNEGAHLWSKG